MISITVSVPKVDYARKKWLDAIASKQRAKSLTALRRLFKETVNGWSKKPDFGWAQTKSASEVVLRVYPTGPHAGTWNLVNEGSPPHTINAKPRSTLNFRKGYRSATKPGQLRSGRKYRSLPWWVAKKVDHPGFEGRKFTELIAQKFAEDYAMDMQEAVTEVAQRA